MQGKPVKVKKATLVRILKEMLDCVERNDSYEGSIAYTCIDDECSDDEFIIKGGYRFGNSDGQGSYRVLSRIAG